MTHSALDPAPPAGPRPAGRSALVIGGGLAGTTAALALADAGLRVTLVEGRPRLGGLAFSFHRSSPAGVLSVDNGQHVYLRCCTAYQWFLERVGAARLAPLQGRLDVPVLDARGRDGRRLGRLRRTALPVPLHLSASLATYPHLSLAERAQVGRAALALGRLDPEDPALDGVDFAGWLRRHGQSPRAVEALWDLVGVATLNATAPHVSLGLAAMVFKTGLLSRPGAADIGWARAPLGELHHTHAHRALDAAGVRTDLRTRVTAVTRTPEGRWSVATAGRPGEEPQVRADVLVLAVPQREAHALLPDGALKDPGRLLRIGTAPILNLHVIYDRTVLGRPFFAAIGSPVQWVFDRTDASGLRDAPGAGDSQYLAVSQSAAYDDIDRPVAELRARYLPELERLLPVARGARVRDFFVTRERTATFAPVPGVGLLRPSAPTDAPGLYLAGAWTATGWPATMEGAVRSGLSAARAALTDLGSVFGGGARPRAASGGHLPAVAGGAVTRKAEDRPRTGRTRATPTTQRGAVPGVGSRAAPPKTDPGPPACEPSPRPGRGDAQGGGMSTTTKNRGETVTPATPGVDTAGVMALLDRGRTLATPVLRAAVDRLAPPMNTVAAYHFGWIDAEGHPAEGDGGKAVRPALALLSAEAAGAAPEAGVPGAVAVELVHNFSLLHDDLMDGDEQRRHRDTVWKVHGPAQAILVGDALFALANEILLELGTAEAGRATRRLTAATRKLIDGQAQDISYEHRERVTVEECLEMEGNKTGALLACAASIGAVLGGADDRTADTLEAYGYHLGLAFQAVDDLLGIWGDPEATGKRTWSDLRQRKKSLPVVAALDAGGPDSERLAQILAADAHKPEEEFADFSEEEFAVRAALIEQAGGRDWTSQEARRQHATAMEALGSVDMPAEIRARFVALADFVVVRER